MRLALLIDFGSTYTKVVAVDLVDEQILAVSQAPSTVDSNVMVGLQNALQELKKRLPHGDVNADVKLACSSAAGGLRMLAIGLVPELTAEAARRAALGAGAKVIRVFSHRLNHRELDQVKEIRPDIILLAGGTDGGNQEVVLHNAQLLADLGQVTPVVVACNKEVTEDVATILGRAGIPAFLTDNVMPELDNLNVEPAREVIRDIFIERIVSAKGIDKARVFVGDIIMPTPMATLNAARLLADGTEDEQGLGELVVVEVGGATTNIHSISKMNPLPGTIPKGLPEPYAKRTVEGDMGLRINAESIFSIVGKEKIIGCIRGVPGFDVAAATQGLSANVACVPSTDIEFGLDTALAQAAVDIAVERHVGEIRTVYGSQGAVMLQYGKNLSDVKTVVGTGGIFAYGREPRKILEAVLAQPNDGCSLRPKAATFYVDQTYIMFAMGLLSRRFPDKAVRILKKHLKLV